MDWRIFSLLVSLVAGAQGLTCLQCKGISQPRHCKVVDECYAGEVCGVEQVRNALGDTVYDVGCIKETKCHNVSLSEGPSSTECRQCCHSDLCNAKGCGEPGYPQSRGPICFNCPFQTNPNKCHDIAFCDTGDVCKYGFYNEFGDMLFTGDCSSAHECTHSTEQGTNIIGRDLLGVEKQRNPVQFRTSLTHHVCSGCCDTDLCNKECNATTIPTDHCSSSPCTNGHCVRSRDGFTCICDRSYTGVRCETRLKETDCYDVWKNNIGARSGVYRIMLWKTKQMIDVYCDMDTYPYGWTVFQRRFNGSVDFYRNLLGYTNGFGDIHGEFWLGLRFIEELASQYESELRLDVTAANGSSVYEVFQNFSLSEGPGFTLRLGKQTVEQIYDNSLGFSRSNGHDFSTYDHDVDSSTSNCAEENHGGWWYWNCIESNLNGEYISPPGGKSSYNTGWGGFIYHTWLKNLQTLKSSTIMFRKHE